MSYETEPKWVRVISCEPVSFKVKALKFSDNSITDNDQRWINKDFYDVRSDLIIDHLSEYTGKTVNEVHYHLIDR